MPTTARTIIRRDDHTIPIIIKDSAGTNVPVDDALAIKYFVFNLDGAAVIEKDLLDGVTVDEHIVTVTLIPSDTEDLVSGNYIHELQITLADGRVKTVLQDTLIIKKDYIVNE